MYKKETNHLFKKSKIMALWMLFMGFSVLGQVNLEVDTTHIRIGEQISYVISTDVQPKVQFPKLQLDSLGKVEVVHSLPIDTLKKRLYKKYILTCFDSGSYRIPAQEVFMDNQRFLTDSLLINVGTIAVDTTKQKLFPIKSIYKAPEKTWKDYINYIWWIIALLLLPALVWFFAFRKRKSDKKKAEKYIPPIELALSQFQSLDEKQLIEKQKIKEYYIELTEIVRDYIGKDVHIPTMEVTTDELITLLEIHNKSKNIGIDKERIKQLHSFLKEADLVKFAKYKPEENQIQQDRKTAENIINDIQSLVHKPVLDEFGNEIIVKTQEEIIKQIRKKRQTVGLLVAGAVILVALAVSSWYYGFQYVKDTILGHPSKELLEGEWYHSSYGYPSISIETPKVLKAKEFELPPQAKQMMLSNAIFIYDGKMSGFFINIGTNEYNSELKIDLSNAIPGIIKMIESQPNVSDLKYEVEDTNIDGKEAKLIKGTFKEKGVRMNYTHYVVLQGHGLQQIMISSKIDDPYAKKIEERIIKSIRLQTVEEDENDEDE